MLISEFVFMWCPKKTCSSERRHNGLRKINVRGLTTYIDTKLQTCLFVVSKKGVRNRFDILIHEEGEVLGYE
jgi:hypothetical protein